MRFSQTYTLKNNQVARLQRILGERLQDNHPAPEYAEIGNFWLHLAERYQIWIVCTYEDDQYSIRNVDGSEFPKDQVDSKLNEILSTQESNGHALRAKRADKNFETFTTIIKRSNASDKEIKAILEREYTQLSKQEIIDIHNRAFHAHQLESQLSDKEKYALLVEAEITLKIREAGWKAVCAENDAKKFRQVAKIHQDHAQKTSKPLRGIKQSKVEKQHAKKQELKAKAKSVIGDAEFAELQAGLAALRAKRLNITQTSTTEETFGGK